MKLLLHCCCAPCSVGCVDSLRSENIEPHLFWFNPNIHPYTEYKSRRDCLINFAKSENLKLTNIDEYGLRSFLAEVSNNDDALSRCEKCYKMRLEKTAMTAKEESFDTFSTTLLISPYQNHEAIKKIAQELSKKHGIEFLYRDFRPLFKEGQNAAREKSFYMQKYCGCILSEEEKYFGVRSVECGVKSNQTNTPHSSPLTPHSLLLTPHSSFLIPHFLFERLTLLTGDKGLKKLNETNVLVFGAGGVGSWAAEALVRCGVGKIDIIDNDTVCASNINRQIEATTLTVGLPKASALQKRLLEINPECEITAWDELFCIENAQRYNIENADYVIDAIDTINHKLDLIETVCSKDVTLFSSMGMALKMNPSKIKTSSIWKTDVCPLARNVRQGLKKRGFSKDFTVVYSDEQPLRPQDKNESSCEFSQTNGKRINGSIVTVTASAGLLLASLVINDILKE